MSVIELLAVVTIIGILSALAAPNLVRLVRNSAVIGDARDLVSLLTSMRAQAMTRGFPMVACLRGRSYIGPERIARQAFTFRKGTPLLPPPCTGVPCPPTVVNPGIPDFNPGATPPDTRSVDLLLSDNIFWVLPTADDRTFQFVFDMEGNVAAFESQDCAGSVHTAIPDALLPGPMTGSGWVIFLRHIGDPNLVQAVGIRRDGTVQLP